MDGKKCSQVLNATSDRDRFMQAVSLSHIDCQKGGSHLLTRDMAEHWLAEVATERLDAAQPFGGMGDKTHRQSGPSSVARGNA